LTVIRALLKEWNRSSNGTQEEELIRVAGVISVGDWIGGRFEVFDIHEGGMSVVYVASDHQGVRGRNVVALKTLREELLRSRIRVGRFATECRLWVQLGEHPNVVRAHAVEIIERRPYVILELVQGGDLTRWIGTSRLDLLQALRFGCQFCLGMEHAQRQGLHCHRDIKPGNLLITEEGTLKITDFGLARVCEEMVAVRPELPDGSIPLSDCASPQPIIWTDPRDRDKRGLVPVNDGGTLPVETSRRPKGAPSPRSQPQPLRSRIPHPADPIQLDFDSSRNDDSQGLTTLEGETIDYVSPRETFDPRLTRTGARLGTGAYMAPEQFRDPRSVDVRADLYSFGVVLFEMITGELPFNGESLDSLNQQHSLHQPPSIVPAVSPRHVKIARSIDAIVQRCLKKDPDERFASSAELRKALKAVLAQLPRK
jgi:serine/threonine protein kinase